MNKLQFLSLIIPSLTSVVLVVLAWLHSNGRLGRMEKKLDVIEGLSPSK